MGHWRLFDGATSPLLFITYPIPKIVLLPVFFTLVGLGDASRVLLIALTVGYQMLVILRATAQALDPSYLQAFLSMGGTKREAAEVEQSQPAIRQNELVVRAGCVRFSNRGTQ